VGLKLISVAVGWVIWPVKFVLEMTYKVSSGTLSLYSLSFVPPVVLTWNIASFLCLRSRGETFIHGPCFVSPAQVEHVPTRLFYKKEVIRSSREQTFQASSVIGRCTVLSYKEYCTSRFTEVAETDVFVCESKYDDGDKSIKKFNKPFRVRDLSEFAGGNCAQLYFCF